MGSSDVDHICLLRRVVLAFFFLVFPGDVSTFADLEHGFCIHFRPRGGILCMELIEHQASIMSKYTTIVFVQTHCVDHICFLEVSFHGILDGVSKPLEACRMRLHLS